MIPELNYISKSNVCVLPNEVSIRQLMENISKSQEDAFYVCDLGQILRRYKEWNEQLPRVKPFYAVKCNPHPALLEVLTSLGTGFDCASISEMQKILSLGVNPDDIIFANPTKSPSHIRFARDNKVKTMTFDSECELHKIRKIFPEAQLVLRICYDSSSANRTFGRKFGIKPAYGPALLRKAKELQLNVIGVSFHIGSGEQQGPVFSSAIATCKWIFTEAELIGYNFHLLDIGGGFPAGPGLSKFAEVINESFVKYFPEDLGVTIIAEPGRYFAASVFTFAASIHTVKEPLEITDKQKYYINDSVYTNLSCRLIEPEIKIPVEPLVNSKISKSKVRCTIWGQTCDSKDEIMGDVDLPVLEEGDWLLFPNMGAYTLSVASEFNGFSASTDVYTVINYDSWIALKTEIGDVGNLIGKTCLKSNVFDKINTFNEKL